jgi:hypothetical protein
VNAMFRARSRPKIPAIFYLYVIALLAMTALAVSQVNVMAVDRNEVTAY